MRITEIISNEYGWMLIQAQRLCRNKMDAEDLVQDAVLKILCNQQFYDMTRPFRPWASVIILNTYITKFKHDSLIQFADVECSIPIPSLSDTSSRIEVSEVISVVRRCRSRSTSVDCVLMYAIGYTYDEIAEYYNIPSGTVRSRINYARNILKKELGNQYVK